MGTERARTSTQQNGATQADVTVRSAPARASYLARPTWLPRGMHGWVALALEHGPFLVSFCVAAFLMTINVALPWGGIHEDNGLVFESIAVNQIRFGFGVTKGQALATTAAFHNLTTIPGVPDSQQFQYLLHGPVQTVFYLDHPPLIGLSIALNLFIFGFQWWVVRMVSIVYMLGSLILFYLLMRYLFTRQSQRHVPWVATALFATFPLTAYYGRNVAHESMVLFWTLAMLLGYFHWLRDERRRWLFLMAASSVIGVFYDWPMFYFACILFAAHWVFTRRFSRAMFLATAVSATLALALVFAQIAWILQGNLRAIVNIFLLRTGADSLPFSKGMWLRMVLSWNRQDYGMWSQVLLVFVLAFLVWRLRVEGWSPRLRFVTLTMLFGVSHILIFHQAAFYHDYWQFYLLPFYAAAFGWAGVALVQRFVPRPALAGVVLAGLAVAALMLNWHVIYGLYTTTNGHAFVPITHYLFPGS